MYVSAVAEELAGEELARGIDIFSQVSEGHGAHPWTLEEVQAPAVYRLYRAIASKHWVLEPGSRPNRRTEVTL